MPPISRPSRYDAAQVRAYLAKVGFPGFASSASSLSSSSSSTRLPPPTLETLSLLMAHHLTTFAFENTHIHYEASHSASIDPRHLFERFVDKGIGGGWCMQQNTLLLEILVALGYRAFNVTGRVAAPPSTPDGPWELKGWNHSVILVWLDCHLSSPNRPTKAYYLVDVGFGGAGLQRPMLFREGHTERGIGGTQHRLVKTYHPDLTFRDEHEEDFEVAEEDRALVQFVDESQKLWSLQHREHPDQAWLTRYVIQLVESGPTDFASLNWFTSTSPDAIFMRDLLIAKYTLDTSLEVPAAIQEADELDPRLHPYHPWQMGCVTHFGGKTTISKPVLGASITEGEAQSMRMEKTTLEAATEAERVEHLQTHLGLLSELSVGEAVHNIKGRQPEIRPR